MTDAVARVMFVVTLLLVVPTLGFLYLSSRPSPNKGQVVAQFEDAFPLIEGMNVRVGGAIAGSVGRINVSDDGLAEVMLVLDEGVARPRADATASIRQQDTTGDSYVAFAPGRSREPLPEVDGRPTIECSGRASQRCPHTLVAPRLDDLLNAFGPSERTGIKLTLQELSRAVDGRGRDLNRAALDLRPGLVAANRALADVNRQNQALRDVIGDAEAVTGQAADRRAALARSIEALEATLDVTAAETELAGRRACGGCRPPSGAGARTMASLRRTATAARPLAVEVRDGAPQLATAVRRAPGFLGDLRSFLVRARPTLQLTHRLLRAAGPDDRGRPHAGGHRGLRPGAGDLEPAARRARRGRDHRGAVQREVRPRARPRPSPATSPGYPAEHADRRFMRVTAILNCEGFGAEIQPGCLVDLLDLARARAARAGEDARPAGPDARARPPRRRRGGPGRPAAHRAGARRRLARARPGRARRPPLPPAPTAPAPASPAPSGQTIREPPGLPAQVTVRPTRRAKRGSRLVRGADAAARRPMLLGVVVLAVGAFLLVVGFLATTGPPFQEKYRLRGDRDRAGPGAAPRAGGAGRRAPGGHHQRRPARPPPRPRDGHGQHHQAGLPAAGLGHEGLRPGALDRLRDLPGAAPGQERAPSWPTATRLRASAASGVDLLETVQLFDRKVRRDLRGPWSSAGIGVAGRGRGLNAPSPTRPPLARDLSAQLGAATRDDGALGRIVAGASRTARGARGTRPDDVAGLITSADLTLDTVARRREDLRLAIRRLPAFEDTFLTVAPEAEPLLDDVAALSDDLRPTVRGLNATLPALNGVLANGRVLRVDADRLADAADPVLRLARPAVYELFPVMTTLRPLNADLRTLLTRIGPYRTEYRIPGQPGVRKGSGEISEAGRRFIDATDDPVARGLAPGAPTWRVLPVFTPRPCQNPFPKPGQADKDTMAGGACRPGGWPMTPLVPDPDGRRRRAARAHGAGRARDRAPVQPVRGPPHLLRGVRLGAGARADRPRRARGRRQGRHDRRGRAAGRRRACGPRARPGRDAAPRRDRRDAAAHAVRGLELRRPLARQPERPPDRRGRHDPARAGRATT